MVRIFLVFLVICAVGAGPGLAEPRMGAPITRIALGSCADQRLPQPIWDAVLAFDPDLFIFMGDNVYGSGGDIDLLDQAYADFAATGHLDRLRAASEVLAVWDDHDYAVNDGGADNPLKEEAQALFYDFWQVPEDDPRRQRPGIYTVEHYGPEGQRVQVILLDTRFFKSPFDPTDTPNMPGKERYVPSGDRSRTMLGEAQWAWLESVLRRPAELRVIVSSMQVIAEGHGYERWGLLPHERRRLFALISETRAEGVILASGDRHLGALYRYPLDVAYPLYELSSSSLNRPFDPPYESGVWRQGPTFGAANFGTIEIDWQARRVTLALRDEAGAVGQSLTVPFAELQPVDPAAAISPSPQ